MNPTPQLFARSSRQRVVAGVCGGIGERLAVDPTLVRLVFATLALAGGAGAILYLALWAHADARPAIGPAVLVAAAGAALFFSLGLSGPAMLGATLLLAGLAVVLVRGGTLRPGGSLPVPGIALLMVGAVVFLSHGASGAFVAPGAVAGALVLVVGPWLWRLVADRSERIRLQERADMAARVHDSVLQTLALVQRHADDPVRIATLARRQERELRRWLYGSGIADAATLVDALADAATDVEELHGIAVEISNAGDAPLDDAISQLVLAAREALTNAAKFAGVRDVALYAEVDDRSIAVYVRDRGAGFDRSAVDPARRGLVESIEGRMARAGGTAAVVSALGEGTEVELRLPRRPA